MPLQLFGVSMGFNITTDRRLTNAEALVPTPPPPLDTPTVIGNLAVWYDAAKGVTSDAQKKVSVWADQSGNGNNATQTTATIQPTYESDVSGAYVRVGGGIPYTLDMATVAMGANSSVWVMLKGTADPLVRAPTYMPPILYGVNTGAAGALQIGNGTDYFYSYMAGGVASTTMITPADSMTIVQLEQNAPVSDTIITNNSGSWTITGNNFGSYHMDSFIGAAYKVTSFVDIYEVVVFNVTLSAQQKVDMHAYFTNKYSLGF